MKKNKKPQPSLTKELEYDGSTLLPDVKQELFCELYGTKWSEGFMGNAMRSYMAAYGYMARYNQIEQDMVGARLTHGRGKNWHISEIDKLKKEKISIENTCKSNGWRLLTNAYVKSRVRWYKANLQDEIGADGELNWAMAQNKDWGAKVQAIVHFDKKMGRVTEKVDIGVHKAEPIEGFNYFKPAPPKKK